MISISSYRTLAGGICCALASACGGTGEVNDSSNGTASQALGVSAFDIPPAAAAYVKVNNVKQLWVFICDVNKNLQRRRTVDNVWQPWEQVDTGCDSQSTPTIGTWPGTKTDTVMVYFRSTSSKLYEVTYGTNGASTLRNISSSSGVGNIVGSPVVVGTTASPAIGVAVRKSATNELVTLDWYSGSWHVHPVGGASSPVKTTAPVFAFYDFSSKDYLTVQVSSIRHAVYSRNSFADSYRIKKGPFWSPYGVLSAIGSYWGEDSFLIARSSDGDLIKMPIEEEGEWETVNDGFHAEGSPATAATTDRDVIKCMYVREVSSIVEISVHDFNNLSLPAAPTPFSGFAVPINGTGDCKEHVLYRAENNDLFIMSLGTPWEPSVFGAFNLTVN